MKRRESSRCLLSEVIAAVIKHTHSQMGCSRYRRSRTQGREAGVGRDNCRSSVTMTG